MKRTPKLLMSIGAIVLLIAIFAGPIMSNVETPNYTVLSSDNNIEIREYDSLIMATITQDAGRKEAISSGFSVLADYIFGNTQTGESISMTAPVVQHATENDQWEISFIMPSEYSLDSLPKPNNNAVSIRTAQKQQFIVLEYSGSTGDDNVIQHQKLLDEYISANGIKVVPRVYHAFYNPPWTLPMMRRNEVMYQLQ